MNIKYVLIISMSVTLNIYTTDKSDKDDVIVNVIFNECNQNYCSNDICDLKKGCTAKFVSPFEVPAKSRRSDVRAQVSKQLNLGNNSRVSIYRLPSIFLVRVVNYSKKLLK